MTDERTLERLIAHHHGRGLSRGSGLAILRGR